MLPLKIIFLTLVLIHATLSLPNQPYPPSPSELIKGLIDAITPIIYKSGNLIRAVHDHNTELTKKWAADVTVSGDVDALIRAVNGLIPQFFKATDQILDQTNIQIEILFKQFHNQIESSCKQRRDLQVVGRSLHAIHNIIRLSEGWVKDYINIVKVTLRAIVTRSFVEARKAHTEETSGYDLSVAEQHFNDAVNNGVYYSGKLLDVAGVTIIKEVTRASAVMLKWSDFL